MSAAAQREPRNILIIRLSALGDVVMSSGLIRAMKARYPNARLSWLTEAPAAPLLKHNPRLDEVIIWPKAAWKDLWRQRQWAQLWREVKAFRRLLRDRQFDLVLDAQGLLKSGLWAWSTHAPRRLGLIPREGSQHLVHERVEPPPGQDVRMGSEYRYLARYVGAADEAFQPDLAIGAAAQARARQSLAEAQVAGPYVALCPFTTRPQKHWFEDNWSALATALLARGLTPVMLGGPDDVTAAGRMAAAVPGVVNLVGQLKLDESVAVVADCALLIGVDTGLTHMGSALQRPTVALFGSTRPYADGGSPHTRILYDALPCSPCRRRPTCEGRFDCMRQITVDRVLQLAWPLLDKVTA